MCKNTNLLTPKKKNKLDRDNSIREEFNSLPGMKGPKYDHLAEKYGLSRVSVQKIILGYDRLS